MGCKMWAELALLRSVPSSNKHVACDAEWLNCFHWCGSLLSDSFFMENQYPDEAKREEIANACNSVIQKPGTETLF